MTTQQLAPASPRHLAQAIQPQHHPRQTGRVPVRKLLGVQMLTTGGYVPEQVLTNAELAAKHGFDPEWIVQRTGIEERRIAPPGVGTSDLAVAAARRCMERANVTARDIDLLIIGTFTPDTPVPSAACRVQDKLGLQCPAMDIQAACAGFMYSMITASQFVATGCSRLALVVGAECLSRITNPNDQGTFPLFGDAAGAALVAAGGAEQGLLAYSLGADGSGASLIQQRMGGSCWPPTCEGLQQGRHYVEMDGRSVFKWAIRILVDSVHDVTEAAGVSLEDIHLFILHQANVRILDAAADSLGLRHDRMFNNLHKYGNTSAASVPLALDEALAAGRLHRGDLVLLSGFGAGLTWGTALLRW
jgi:3-oxoacyl-[acyl-carrier-protein] synthase-3